MPRNGIYLEYAGRCNQRKYDYTYDKSGRLIKALFNEKKTSRNVWVNAKLDFSRGGNGTAGSGTASAIQYDLNGNLLSLYRKGVSMGSAGSSTVDNLSYTYAALSNKLIKVTDNGTMGASNCTLGDFKDGANGSNDYTYDANDNLIIDLYKNTTVVSGGVSAPIDTSGITYNFLDKPELINISGKDTIKILYDADGNKLQPIFTPVSGTALQIPIFTQLDPLAWDYPELTNYQYAGNESIGNIDLETLDGLKVAWVFLQIRSLKIQQLSH